MNSVSSEKTPSVMRAIKTSRGKCFVIMPLADHKDYDPGHFTRVYKELIVPACKKAKFIPSTAAETMQSHQIMPHILRSIQTYDMAICDLSTSNANVFYELGIRQMAKMPVALIKDERTDDKFDLLGFRREIYSSSLRADQVKAHIQRISESLIQTYENRDDITSEFLSHFANVQVDPKQTVVSEGEALIGMKLNQVLDQISKIQTSPLPEYSYPLTDVDGKALGVGDFFSYEFIKRGNISKDPADDIGFITKVLPQDDCIVVMGPTDAHSGLSTHVVMHIRLGTLGLRKRSYEWVKSNYPNVFEKIKARVGSLQYLFRYHED